MKVYLREEGDYEQADIVAVYPSLEAAKTAVVSEKAAHFDLAGGEANWEYHGDEDGWWSYGITRGLRRTCSARVMEYEVEATDGLRFVGEELPCPRCDGEGTEPEEEHDGSE
jgi:hypothetical protein